MPTETQPLRRKWNITRWLLVFALVAMAWSGWRAYAFRSALAEAKALGWYVKYTAPVERIRADWKAAFKKETWLDGVTLVEIPMSEAFEQHLTTVHRLNPKTLVIEKASTLRDISALIPLTRLQVISLRNCAALTNLDALKNFPAIEAFQLADCRGVTSVDALMNLPALREVYLEDCTGLTNVDALMNLSALKTVWLYGCTGLSPESVAALRTALPHAEISGP